MASDAGAPIGFTDGMVTDGMDDGARPRRSETGAGDTPSRPVVVLLAAGVGSRFAGAGHKLLAQVDPTSDRPAESVIERSLAAAASVVSDGLAAAVVVVTGAADVREQVDRVAAEFAIADRVHVAHNPRFAEGQAGSVHVGLAAVRHLGADTGVVGLADQPDVAPATWAAVTAAASRSHATPITVATYDGRPRNPVALHHSVWDQLPTEGDRGARDVIRLHPDLVTPIPSHGSPADIDTVEDLRRWQST